MIDTSITLTSTMFLGVYAYSATAGELLWQTSQLFSSEEEAIGYCLTMSGVEHIRIIKVPKMQTHVLPDTLKTLNTQEGEVIDYATQQD
jgi:hypothetical protein